MDQAPLVEMLTEDGRRLLERLAEEGVEVTAACWLRKAEDGQWFLYLATPLVDAEGRTRGAYRRVNEVIRQMPHPLRIGPFDIKVIGPDHALAAAAQEIHRRYPGNSFYYRGAQFGDMSVEGVYVYPPIPQPSARPK